MRLNEIADRAGARQVRKRRGRGIGSGLGKTAGRGGKGQTARSGGAKPGFEGGQMPIYRRLPKRGFRKPNAVEYNEINVARIQEAFDARKLDSSKPVTVEALNAAGIVRHCHGGVRILGNGELKTKAFFEVYHASQGAIAAIEKAGGSVKLLKPAEKKTAEEGAPGETKKPS
jgi:large subunit ribosomal protein L15